MVIGCNFHLRKPEAVLEVCRRYSKDRMEQVLYGRGLALCQLGRLGKTTKALDLAID